MVGQSFSTIPVPNLIPAVYGIGIQQGAIPYIRYNFPITPSSVRKEFPSMTTTYEVQGTPTQNGVVRIADEYGQAPPQYIIEGTTGWQRHQSDGYLLTGLEAVQTLEAILTQYAQLNAQAVQQNTQSYTLEFYDYFSNSFWQIVPVGPQGFYQDNSRPLLTFYRFRFMAIASLAGAASTSIGEVDALAQVFATPVASAALNAVATTAGLFNLYEPGVQSAVTSLVNKL